MALKEIEREASPLIPSPAEWKVVVGHLAAGVLPIVYPRAQRYCEGHAANAPGAALRVATVVQTGERLDELRHMRLEDIGTDEIRVAATADWSPKNHRNRTIPVPGQTATLAKEFVAWRDRAVGLLMGHSEIGVTQRYAHLSADHLHRAASETKVAPPVPPGGDATGYGGSHPDRDRQDPSRVARSGPGLEFRGVGTAEFPCDFG